MRDLSFRRLPLIGYLLSVAMIGCTTSAPRPDFEGAPTAAPRPAPGPGGVAMAMDETSDPDVPGGRPDATAMGDTTIALTNVGYDVVYSETKRNPLVVTYFLRPLEDDDPALCASPSNFTTDNRTEANVKHADFANKGFDRGHMAPNSAIGRRHGCEAQTNTFLLSNIKIILAVNST